MKLLLVTLRKRPGSEDISRRETIHEGMTIQVGRAVTMEICLPDIGVDFHHADLEMQDGRLTMIARGEGGLATSGGPADKVDLGSGQASIQAGQTLHVNARPWLH